jgi:hypothetical protein
LDSPSDGAYPYFLVSGSGKATEFRIIHGPERRTVWRWVPCSGHLTACEQLRRGTIKKLQGNVSLETQLTATVFAGVEKVKAVNSDGTVVPS